MKVVCPQCGSENVKRQPGAAANGWNFIKAGIFTILLAIALPFSTNTMILMGLGGFALAGIGVLIWLLGIGRSIAVGGSANWSWECQACKKEFETVALGK